MTSSVIENVRASLASGRKPAGTPASRPAILPARKPGSVDAEIETFLQEVRKLSGTALVIEKTSIPEALKALVAESKVQRATVWETPLLKGLNLAQELASLGVELVSPNADKMKMATCDLGVTEADYILPETGTLVLKSSAEKPRGVSLLPRIHLAIVTPDLLRADLQQVFEESRSGHYMVFITGPSRTSDIELTVTLGVHGPKNLFVWMLQPDKPGVEG